MFERLFGNVPEHSRMRAFSENRVGEYYLYSMWSRYTLLVISTLFKRLATDRTVTRQRSREFQVWQTVDSFLTMTVRSYVGY